MRRLRVLTGATLRFLVMLAVVAGLVAVPLLSVHRAECEGGDARYRFELPWEEGEPPAGCDFDQDGWEILREELGLD